MQAGDLLYRLERAPFEAALAQQGAAVADASARLANANIQLTRAQSLLNTPAGQRSTVDDATANQRSQAAQVASAQAQLRIAQINLDYTEIHAPIGGKISRTNITVGNVVSPSSGPLATIVSQDPMYVLFPIAVRAEIDLEKRYANQGGMGAVVIRLRLPDGTIYGQSGKIDYIEPSVQATTDTILVRGKIANPPLKPIEAGKPVRPTADRRRVRHRCWSRAPSRWRRWRYRAPRCCPTSRATTSMSSTARTTSSSAASSSANRRPSTAVIMAGLKEGETVMLEGIQRVRPGIQVTPGPAAPHADRAETGGSIAA